MKYVVRLISLSLVVSFLPSACSLQNATSVEDALDAVNASIRLIAENEDYIDQNPGVQPPPPPTGGYMPAPPPLPVESEDEEEEGEEDDEESYIPAPGMEEPEVDDDEEEEEEVSAPPATERRKRVCKQLRKVSWDKRKHHHHKHSVKSLDRVAQYFEGRSKLPRGHEGRHRDSKVDLARLKEARRLLESLRD